MSHAILVQKVLHHLATSRLVGDAQGLVFDVRSQAVGVDLNGGLQRKFTIFHQYEYLYRQFDSFTRRVTLEKGTADSPLTGNIL